MPSRRGFDAPFLAILIASLVLVGSLAFLSLALAAQRAARTDPAVVSAGES